MDIPLFVLSAIVFLPALAALVVAFIPKGADDAMRYVTLVTCGAVLVLALVAFAGVPGFEATNFDIAQGSMQNVFNVSWIPSFNIFYFMGVDGISLPLVVLTAFVSMLAAAASWSITKQVKGYCILFLLLVTGMLGVFMALDFFLFYVFWEVMLLPMYFLIGVWGGPRREYAAIKFFLYTLLGSVLMLVALLIIYFNSDLVELAQKSDLYGNENAAVSWDELHVHPDVTDTLLGRGIAPLQSGPSQAMLRLTLKENPRDHQRTVEFRSVPNSSAETPIEVVQQADGSITVSYPENTLYTELEQAIDDSEAGELVEAEVLVIGDSDGQVKIPASREPTSLTLGLAPGDEVHTFNLLALAAIGQHTDAFTMGHDAEGNPVPKEFLGLSVSIWAFVLLLIGFLIKVPSVPLHTWLPDAHVEAPTPISMILAGVLLKMGGYGIIRICYPICPEGGYELAYVVCLIGLVSMVYGAFAAMAQTDFKRLVAYSSVSHMGYVVLGLGVWSLGTWAPETMYNGEYWNMGIKGAMFQMIGHGISSAGMFFVVGVIYDRVHHRNLNEFGGLFGRMPVYTALSMGIFFAGLGLPGLCGFIGEFFVVLSAWKFSTVIAVISASVVILTAGYILWAIQRVYMGAEYKGPHGEELTDIGVGEGKREGAVREFLIASTLFVFAILFGVFPHTFALQFMDATVDRQVEQLADWTEQYDRQEYQARLDAGEAKLSTNSPPRRPGGVDQSAGLSPPVNSPVAAASPSAVTSSTTVLTSTETNR